MIRIGVIGAGIICERHIKAIGAIENGCLVAIADIVIDRAKKLTSVYGGNEYADYKQMVDCENLDAVIINVPHYLHEECTVFCLERNLHVLIEKPMAMCVEECDHMLSVAKKNNRVLLVGHIQRYIQENIWAKELIQSGTLGMVTSLVDIRNINYFSENRPQWFFQRRLSGGGMLMNYGVHSLDKMSWLLESSVTKAYGHVGYHHKQFDIESNASVCVQFDNGVIATLNYSGHKHEHPINETLIHMTKGSIKLLTGKAVYVDTGNGYKEVTGKVASEPFVAQLSAFVHQITHNTQDTTSGVYGKHIIATIEQIYQENRSVMP